MSDSQHEILCVPLERHFDKIITELAKRIDDRLDAEEKQRDALARVLEAKHVTRLTIFAMILSAFEVLLHWWK